MKPAPIILYCLVFSWLSFSFRPLRVPPVTKESTPALSSAASDAEAVTKIYNTLSLESKGLSLSAFQYAYKGYTRLLTKNKIRRQGILTICDFSQSSNRKRLYIIDLENQALLVHTYVAHGKNSGGEYATRFSNRPESLQSSLGFYVTNHTYQGGHGLSLRMSGLEPGFNDKAMHRNIVVHGADYIEKDWLEQSNRMGRSFGCPAVPRNESAQIIQTIKDGTCLFVYYPANGYIKKSKILNG